MNKKIVCVGALNVDHILYVDSFAKIDGEEIIKEFLTFSGGQAGNIASGLGRLGKPAYFFGNIGDDFFTSLLEKDLDEDHVDYSFSKRTSNKNNTVISVVDKKGERQLYAYNNVELSTADFPDELLDNTYAIVFTSLIKDDIIDTYCEIAKLAKEKNVMVILDPGHIFAKKGFDELKPLLSYCDYIFPNENELELILGNKEIDDLLEIVPNIIATRGEKGTRFFSAEKKSKDYMLDQKDFGDVIDTTGAGDCFLAAFISAFMDYNDEEKAIKYALIASKISITRKGARTMPSKEEIEVIFNEK